MPLDRGVRLSDHGWSLESQLPKLKQRESPGSSPVLENGSFPKASQKNSNNLKSKNRNPAAFVPELRILPFAVFPSAVIT